jgi:hypothetical protein
VKKWMMMAITQIFEPSMDESPSQVLSDKKFFSGNQYELDEEYIQNRPEIQEFIQHVNQSINDNLNSFAPTPKKIRLSKGFPGLSLSPARLLMSDGSKLKYKVNSLDQTKKLGNQIKEEFNDFCLDKIKLISCERRCILF